MSTERIDGLHLGRVVLCHAIDPFGRLCLMVSICFGVSFGCIHKPWAYRIMYGSSVSKIEGSASQKKASQDH